MNDLEKLNTFGACAQLGSERGRIFTTRTAVCRQCGETITLRVESFVILRTKLRSAGWRCRRFDTHRLHKWFCPTCATLSPGETSKGASDK
jgi:hypothetical protein